MKVILSVEALEPMLTGIGRYTWELASRLPVALGKKKCSLLSQWALDQ